MKHKYINEMTLLQLM